MGRTRTVQTAMAQMGFFDLSDRYASLNAKKDPLVEIDAVVPWEEFRPFLDEVWRKPDAERRSRAGRMPMDTVLMFKSLVLSTLYNLSDGCQDGVALSRRAGAGRPGRGAAQPVRRLSGAAWLHRTRRADLGCIHRVGAA